MFASCSMHAPLMGHGLIRGNNGSAWKSLAEDNHVPGAWDSGIPPSTKAASNTSAAYAIFKPHLGRLTASLGSWSITLGARDDGTTMVLRAPAHTRWLKSAPPPYGPLISAHADVPRLGGAWTQLISLLIKAYTSPHKMLRFRPTKRALP